MLTFDEVDQLLRYEPDTGVLYWKVNRRGGVKADTIAGTTNQGYIIICVNTIKYQAHRLAWLLQTGEWPMNCIDHINRIRDDNRWCNLREATRSQNSHNVNITKRNTSSVKGLSWYEYNNRWEGRIVLNGKTYTKASKDKQVCIDWLTTKRAELHQEFAKD